MPDWDNTESRERDEDAAWRDLVARFDEPATTAGPVPWPERENVPGQRPQGGSGTGGATAADDGRGERRAGGVRETGDNGGQGASRGDGDTRGARGARGVEEARGVEGIRGFDDEGVRGAFGAEGRPGRRGGDGPPATRGGDEQPATRGGDGRPGTQEPDVIQAARRGRRTPAHGEHGTRARRIRARKAPPQPVPADDEEHYVPPAPPPLPKLDPITKGAWVALFGGPAYLVTATAAGWPVPGIAAFLAVAAFVTGFALLVLRMNEPGPGGPDDGDDGAVV